VILKLTAKIQFVFELISRKSFSDLPHILNVAVAWRWLGGGSQMFTNVWVVITLQVTQNFGRSTLPFTLNHSTVAVF
jgi:hypothetical protein